MVSVGSKPLGFLLSTLCPVLCFDSTPTEQPSSLGTWPEYRLHYTDYTLSGFSRVVTVRSPDLCQSVLGDFLHGTSITNDNGPVIGPRPQTKFWTLTRVSVLRVSKYSVDQTVYSPSSQPHTNQPHGTLLLTVVVTESYDTGLLRWLRSFKVRDLPLIFEGPHGGDRRTTKWSTIVLYGLVSNGLILVKDIRVVVLILT